jgi:hypothetical protein
MHVRITPAIDLWAWLAHAKQEGCRTDQMKGERENKMKSTQFH